MTNATWKKHPGSNNYSTSDNWSGGAVPDEIATFGASSRHALTSSAHGINVGAWTFTTKAGHYSFTLKSAQQLFFDGAGIDVKGGSSVTITSHGELGFGDVNDPSAGKAHIIVAEDGVLGFNTHSTAGKAHIEVNGRAGFSDHSTAGRSLIDVSGTLKFSNSSGADKATIRIGKTGAAEFLDEANADNARLITKAGGKVDFSDTLGLDHKVTAGSIAGGGSYFLGENELTVGSDGRSTKVSGLIADSGENESEGASLVKVGHGTLTLSHANNSYTGGTTLEGGTLNVAAFRAAGNGAIHFGDGVQTLKIQNKALSNHVFENKIDSWGGGDRIDLAGLKFTKKIQIDFQQGVDDVTLLVKNGKVTDTLSLTNFNFDEVSLTVKKDGHGGTLLVVNNAQMLAKAGHHSAAETAGSADVEHHVGAAPHDDFLF